MTNGISARTADGEHVAVETRDTDGTVITSATEQTHDPNPRKEPTIRVRVIGPDFMNEGTLRKTGDEIDMPIGQARAAAMYVRRLLPDGSVVSVPHESQTLTDLPPSANITGMQRHERVEALQKELDALDARRDAVAKELERENDALDQEIAIRRTKLQERKTTDGSKPQTTANPPREGEDGGTKTPKPPSGEPAKF